MENRPEKRARVDAAVADDGKDPYFSLGGNTYKVYMSLHKDNRARLVAAMKKAGGSGIIVLKGGETVTRHDTDHEEIFRQESYFQWCFGVKEPDMYGSINIDSGAACLFIPRMPETVEPWIGAIEPPASFKQRYDVDSVAYADEVHRLLNLSPTWPLYSATWAYFPPIFIKDKWTVLPGGHDHCCWSSLGTDHSRPIWHELWFAKLRRVQYDCNPSLS